MKALDINGREIKVGDKVRIYLIDRASRELVQRGVGTVVGSFPQDPQGLPGCLTIDTGLGCHEYVSVKLLEVVDKW